MIAKDRNNCHVVRKLVGIILELVVAVFVYQGWFKVREITEAEKAKMREYRREWLKIGLFPEETDWGKSEEIIGEIYKAQGKDVPVFVHSRSPIESTIYRHACWFCWDEDIDGLPPLKELSKIFKAHHHAGPRDIGEENYPKITPGEQFSAYDNTHHDQLRLDIAAMVTESATKSKKKIKDGINARMFDKEKQRESCSCLLSNAFWGQHEWWIPYYLFPEQYLEVKYEEKESCQAH